MSGDTSKSYLYTYFSHLLEGLGNFFIFLPYYFSVSRLTITFFAPWKNLSTTADKSGGWSMAKILDAISFNLISRFIGAMMRFFIILGFLFCEVAYLLALPLIVAVALALFPFALVLRHMLPTHDQKKARAKEEFVKSHLLEEHNRRAVEEWFEHYYTQNVEKVSWWRLSSLLTVPPLARDWTAGYTPTLEAYCQDLSDPSYQTHIGHIVDRQKEIDEIVRSLLKAKEANVIVVGEEGIGKHTIINALSRKLYQGGVPSELVYKRLLKLDMEKVLASMTDQKVREEFLDRLFIEAQEARNIILFIDNLDRYVSSVKDRVDMTTPIQKHAVSESLQFISTTTPTLYEKYIQPNTTIAELFEKVDVAEVSKDRALLILLDYVPRLEARYHLTIPYETLIRALDQSESYVTDFPFPEKVMKILDSACILVAQSKGTSVQPEVVSQIISEKTHIPTTLTEDLRSKLLGVEQALTQNVLCQNEALHKLSTALHTAFLDMGKRKKPLATMLFLGPTGVGKTEAAKALATHLFGDTRFMTRLDMSLYQTKEDIARLVGAGQEATPGLLTAIIREKPYTVLLLDEIEKASQDLLNIFLTVLDEGYFTAGDGRRVECKNCIIIATSNAASNLFYEALNKDSVNPTLDYNHLIDYLVQKNFFSPEFLNRFDAIVAFKPLSRQDIVAIAKKMLTSIVERIEQNHKISVLVSDQTLDKWVKSYYDPAFGARDIARVLSEQVEGTVAELLLQKKVAEGQQVQL